MALTEEQKQKLSEIIKLSSKCLVAFRYYILTNGKDEVGPAEYHFDWSKILLNEKENFVVEGFRQSAKGQYVLRSFPLYCLRFPSEDNDYIVLIKQNATEAGKKLLEIEEEYLGNPALNSNLVKVHKQSTEVFSIDVKNNNGAIINIRIEAYGKGSPIRGLANKDRRPRICILDDPQSLEDSRSDLILDNDWKWFMHDIMFLGKTTRIFLIGNNLGDKCIVERAFNACSELNFKTYKVAILDKSGNPSWPEMFSSEFIEKERDSFRKLYMLDTWVRERMCESTSEETRTFDLKDFPRYSYLYMEDMIKNTNIYITVDPASSKDPGSCFRAMIVNAVTEDNRWIIIDIAYGRWESDVFIDELFKLVVRWTPFLDNARRVPVGIEKGHFEQILKPFIMREMQRRNIFFDIKPLEHIKVGTKLQRVKMLAPRVKAHTIMLPTEAKWLAELETELAGVTKDGFKSLFTDLCFAKGTKIMTLFGDKNIENITKRDLIITPFGIRKVIGCGLTGYRKTITKFGLEATPKHKVFCYNKGIASIDSLCYNDTISRYNTKEIIQWKYKSLLCSMEKSFICEKGRARVTTLIRKPMVKSVGMDFIKRCGNFIIKGKSQRVGMFTISMATLLTTTYLTLSVYRLSNTIGCLKTLTEKLCGNILQGLDRLQLFGISLKRARNGISNTLVILLRTVNQKAENVISAVRNIITFTPLQNIVLQGVYKNQLQSAGENTRNESVSFAGMNLNAESISLLKPVQALAQLNTAGNIPLLEKDAKPVYNLTVETDGVYYANGFLVSNCDALAMQQQIARPPIKGRITREGIQQVTDYNPIDESAIKPERLRDYNFHPEPVKRIMVANYNPLE